MSNFVFLAEQWPGIHEAAMRVEDYVNNDPRSACFHARLAVERTVNWLYDHDQTFRKPYDTNLSTLLNDSSFKKNVPYGVGIKAEYIRKLGNRAVHDRRTITSQEAFNVTSELFHILYWLGRTYTQGDPAAIPNRFREKYLAPSRAAIEASSAEQMQQLESSLKEADKELQAQIERTAGYEAELKKLRAQVNQNRAINEQVRIPHDFNEAQTRKHLIDLMLREAGWDPQDLNVVEYPVTGMPNKNGTGFVDYVLWGDDGKPLGLVEAKRTSVDPHEGQRQAELYANCLEQMHGQRPIIFYTNGYETWIWDDQMYPERQVQGLYSKQELMRLIQRRRMRKYFQSVPTNKAIVDRAYQEEAIRSMCEHLSLGHRRGLLVMATGTGKTRVAIALVDVLMRAGWIKRVLFLADRTALVNQSYNAFKTHLPESSPVNLLEEKEVAQGRVVVSTYHTMMNLINISDENDQKRYSVGHFDLIIIDEAHRSVYDKFGAIFDYFDSLLLGLTATPKNEVDRNTYRLFNLPDGTPVMHYELDQAVADGYLTPFKAYSVPLKFQREGIRYRDLSDEEKAEWDQLDWSGEEPPDFIDPGSLNSWLFNTDTVDKVLETLMRKGIKVNGGDRLGKTIIFCKNHKHAQFVQQRFDLQYPEHHGKFARVIDNYQKYAQSLIDDFSGREKVPYIAISVDMLDTGIDIPEVVNLVFFKLVRSKTKFWQMIGRGTRLCFNLFGLGMDKQHFLIFDYCMNFEFFDENPDGYEAPPQESISQRLFKRRLDLLEMVTKNNEDIEQVRLRNNLVDLLHGKVAAMNTDNFIVAAKRRFVDRFVQRDVWKNLSQADFADLSRHISGLPTTLRQEDESTIRFDFMILNIQVSFIENTAEFSTLTHKVISIAEELAGKTAIPMVQENIETIQKCQKPEYWETVSLGELENIRLALRHLIRFLDNSSQRVIFTDFRDEQGELREISGRYETAGVDLQQYRKKVEQFVCQHKDHQVIRKIRYAMPLDSSDLEKLEEFFFEAGEIEGQEAFQKAFPTATSLPKFIRSLVGLDREAAKEAFSRYLDDKTFTLDQIRFINYIIDQLTIRGTFEKRMLYEQPFTDLNSQGIEGMFKDEGIIDGILKVIERINATVRYAG